jgi:D-methionine transport system permease protein
MAEKYLKALGETLIMTTSACAVVFVTGLALALVLTVTAPAGWRHDHACIARCRCW